MSNIITSFYEVIMFHRNHLIINIARLNISNENNNVLWKEMQWRDMNCKSHAYLNWQKKIRKCYHEQSQLLSEWVNFRWLEYSPRKVPGFAKYAVDANLFLLESSILTRAKQAINRNNVATERFVTKWFCTVTSLSECSLSVILFCLWI